MANKEHRHIYILSSLAKQEGLFWVELSWKKSPELKPARAHH